MEAARRYPRTEVEHELGMRAARKRAEWELGDAGWAHIIIRAYLNPEADLADLRKEMEGE